MVIQRVRFTIDMLVDSEKQFLGGKNWGKIAEAGASAMKHGSAPENEVIVEESEVSEVHFHNSTEYENCEGCIQLAQDEKN